jgi:hypothetical protein
MKYFSSYLTDLHEAVRDQGLKGAQVRDLTNRMLDDVERLYLAEKGRSTGTGTTAGRAASLPTPESLNSSIPQKNTGTDIDKDLNVVGSGGKSDQVDGGKGTWPDEGWEERLSSGTHPDLTGTNELPPDAVRYRTHGEDFYAPPEADWVKVHEAGKEAGIKPSRIGEFIGQFGTFDFQRRESKGRLVRKYKDSGNYGVGVFMHGAGFSLPMVKTLGTMYWLYSHSTAKLGDLYKWWEFGWMDANSGEFAKRSD